MSTKKILDKLEKLIVVEEKRGLIEDQLRTVLYELKIKVIESGKSLYINISTQIYTEKLYDFCIPKCRLI